MSARKKQAPKRPKKKRIGTAAGRAARRARSTHARNPVEAEPDTRTKGSRASKGRRLDWIIDRMTAIPDEWNDATRQEYMRIFDVALPTMKVDAAEASRMIERTLEDPQLKRKLELILDETLDELKTIAETAKSPFAQIQAHKERRETVQTFADLRGVTAPKKIDVGIQDNLAALIAVGLGGGPASPEASRDAPASATAPSDHLPPPLEPPSDETPLGALEPEEPEGGTPE